MLNRSIIIGRLTKDVELKKTQSGTSVVSFTIACNRTFKQEGQPEADFINCVAWNKVADLMHQYLHKGDLIGIEGRIQTRSYDDRDGKRVYVTEVVADNVQFLETKKQSNQQQYQAPQNNSYNPYPQQNQYAQQQQGYGSYDNGYGGNTVNVQYDDLPF